MTRLIALACPLLISCDTNQANRTNDEAVGNRCEPSSIAVDYVAAKADWSSHIELGCNEDLYIRAALGSQGKERREAAGLSESDYAAAWKVAEDAGWRNLPLCEDSPSTIRVSIQLLRDGVRRHFNCPVPIPKIHRNLIDAVEHAIPKRIFADFTIGEKKRAVLEKVAEFRAKFDAEQARLKPETAAIKKLARQSFVDTQKGLEVILASPHRKPSNRARDRYRHPIETLTFFEVTPTSTVIELGPGEGWYTEILAPLLKSNGKYYAFASNPNVPVDYMVHAYGRRFVMFRELSPDLYGSIVPVVFDRKPLTLGPAGSGDVLLVIRELHGWLNPDDPSRLLDAARAVLKPGGILGIVQHRLEGADPKLASKTGYMSQEWVIARVREHGFKLVGTSEINANPRDTKDYPNGVWTLPPTLEVDESERAKYEAIGESDRMTLKFMKVSEP